MMIIEVDYHAGTMYTDGIGGHGNINRERYAK